MSVKLDKTMWSRSSRGAAYFANDRQIYVLETNGSGERVIDPNDIAATETLVEGFSDEGLTISLGTGPFTSNADGQFGEIYFPLGSYDLYAPGDASRPITRWQPIVGAVPAEVASLSAAVAALDTRTDVVESSRVEKTHLPVFLVEDYYLPLPVTDKGAAMAAFDAANAATRGGVVQFGPRAYELADWNPVLPSGTAKVIDIKGAGKLSTQWVFSTDRGAGTWAIRSDSDAVAEGLCYSQISDAWIIGPSTTTALDGTPADMRGIRQTRRMRLERLVISGFHSGVQVSGDHTTMRDVDCSQNRYGLAFDEMGTLFGDNLIENCDLTGNTRASWWIANDALVSANVIGGHMGFTMYCIEIENGAAAALSIGGTTFTRTSFEAAGNGWIYSSDKTARVHGVDFIGCGFTRSDTYELGAADADYGIYVNEWNRISMRGCTMRDAWDLGQINCVTASNFDMDRATASWDAAVTAGVAFMIATGGLATGIHLQTDTWKARGAVAAAAVVRGQLVGRNTFFIYPYGGGSVVLEGVALNDADATNLRVCFACYQGENVYTLTKAAITATHSLVVDGTDPNKVSGEANTGATLTRQLVGYPYSGSGGVDSNIQAFIRIA